MSWILDSKGPEGFDAGLPTRFMYPDESTWKSLMKRNCPWAFPQALALAQHMVNELPETCIEGLMNGTVQGGPKLIVCKSDVSNPTDVDLVKNKSWIRASLRFKNDRVLSAFLYADAFLIADHMLKFTMFSTTGPNDTAKIWYGLLCCFPTIV